MENAAYFNAPFYLGKVRLANRLIQGPLAGYSAAPFRRLFAHYKAPAYSVSEMLSATDVVHKHSPIGRYLYRSPDEKLLAYQLSGTDPVMMARAATQLAALGADIIDINCGCPKTKIRKKGAGSALLTNPDVLVSLVKAVRAQVHCPLTVKIRILAQRDTVELAKKIADAGADGLIVHARRWTDDYAVPCDFSVVRAVKNALTIPIIANGDIADFESLVRVYEQTRADAFMISRSGTGKPWLYEQLLTQQQHQVSWVDTLKIFHQHLQGLAALETEHQAVLQSRSLLPYYFKEIITEDFCRQIYQLKNIDAIINALSTVCQMNKE